jgi:hypothetical protein
MHKLLVLTSSIAVFAAACGDDVPPQPDMTELELACADTTQSGVDSQVLEAISVMVTDADRDLVGVDGTINGVQITLTDDDADERFTWSPPDDAEPIACSGELVVSLNAVDKAGHTANLYKVVEK